MKQNRPGKGKHGASIKRQRKLFREYWDFASQESVFDDMKMGDFRRITDVVFGVWLAARYKQTAEPRKKIQ